MNENTLDPRLPRTSRLTLVLLVALFVLPFLLGTALFVFDWRPQGAAQHGELVHPARPLPATALLTPQSEALPAAQLKGKWLLVAALPAACDAACDELVARQLQVYRALGKEQSRVQPVLIAGLADRIDAAANASLAGLAARSPGLVVAGVDSADSVDKKAWQFALEGEKGSIFIVDPFGNVMMRYDARADRRGVLKDLERLLKYSWLRK